MKTVAMSWGILTALLAATCALAQEQRKPALPEVSFVEAGQQLNRLAGRGVALGDFNGDGCLDAFVVNVNSPDGEGHRVYFGDCHGRFTDSGPSLANASGFDGKPAAGDVNGDGKLDVIAGRMVWLNDGKGHFGAHPELIPGPGELQPVSLADLDEDGHLDLVAVAGWRTVRGCLNDGKGNFRDSGQILDPGNAHIEGLAVGDVNGDGHWDLVMALVLAPDPAAKVYLNDWKSHLGDSGQKIGHQRGNSVALGDLNGDGCLDTFPGCGEPHTGTPSEVWLNDGKGNFRDSGLRLGNAFSNAAALGDLNGDGRLADGTWCDPVRLGEPLNTPVQEVFPGLSPDGKYLFFARDTPGRGNDIYWVEAASIPALRP